jgi:hypothetical protein
MAAFMLRGVDSQIVLPVLHSLLTALVSVKKLRLPSSSSGDSTLQPLWGSRILTTAHCSLLPFPLFKTQFLETHSKEQNGKYEQDAGFWQDVSHTAAAGDDFC